MLAAGARSNGWIPSLLPLEMMNRLAARGLSVPSEWEGIRGGEGRYTRAPKSSDPASRPYVRTAQKWKFMRTTAGHQRGHVARRSVPRHTMTRTRRWAVPPGARWSRRLAAASIDRQGGRSGGDRGRGSGWQIEQWARGRDGTSAGAVPPGRVLTLFCHRPLPPSARPPADR